MHLDKLEIRGFKSFRDKTVIEFPDKFMAIIGPNGTGKSNLTEAICFVLGKSRGLRANNMQELIFNGGKHDKPAKKTVVKMHISDGDGKYEIARMVDIEGRSIYKLNGKRVTRQKIVDIVGDNEYNIILQDDVTRVIKMQPTERRTLIDELCGIAEYDKKKEKALSELEKVDEKISDAHIILGEKQGYLNRLKKERDDALQYRGVKGELKTNQASLLNHEVLKYEKRVLRYDEKISEAHGQKEKQQEKIDGVNSQIESTRNGLRDVNKDIRKLEDDRLSSKVSKLKAEIIRNEERLSSMEERLTTINENFEKDDKFKRGLESERIELNHGLEGLSGKLSKTSKEIKEESDRAGGGEFLTQLDKLRESIYQLQSEVSVFEKISTRNSGEIGRLKLEGEDLKKRLNVIEKDADNAFNEKKDVVSGFEEGNKEIEEKRSKLDDTEGELDDVQNSLEETRLNYERKSAELMAIEKGSFGMRSAEKAVMQLKSVIPGIHGPVSQLGKIPDPKFELALVVAARGRLNNIVVDGVETAQKCIDYLRKKAIGRTTFLPLSKINVNTAKKFPNEAIGFAKDHIKYEKRYERVFNYVFGDTIIVDDIETARAIGIGNWRMVTISGDLLERSGAISGGYIKKGSGMIFSNLDELEKEIKTLSEKVETLTENKDILSADREHSIDDIKSLESKTWELKTRLEKLDMEEENLSSRKEELGKGLRGNQDKITSLENEIQEVGKKSEKLTLKLSHQRKELDDALKKRPSAATTRLDELKDEYRDLEIKDGGTRERLKMIDEQLSETLDELRDLDSEREKIEETMEGTRKELQVSNEELLELEGENIDLTSKMKGLFNKRMELDTKIIDLSTGLGELKVDLDRVNEGINKVSVEKARTETELAALQKEFNKYSETHLVDKRVKELEGAIFRLERKLEDFGPINMKAIETYDVVKNEYDDIVEKLETLKRERQSIFDFMDQVEKKKYDTFMKTFEVVKKNFEDIFTKLSGGSGTLILDNPKTISESGLLINASPEGKKIMSLDSMSGGEKVLTSASFLLAIQQYKPSYFYIVDEIDAALDKVNSTRLGEMFRDSKSQFVLVTHNDAMIKYAQSVVGLSMNNGISRIVGVKLGEGEHAA